jgi:hypothetical protein
MPIRMDQLSFSIFRLRPGRTYPQLSQAAWGNFGLLQLGQSTMWGGLKALCARRLRVRQRLFFCTGNMAKRPL